MKTFVAFIFSRFLGWGFRWDFYIIRKIIVDVFPVEIMVNIGEKYLKIVAAIEPRQRLHFPPPPGAHVAQEVCDPISFVDDWKGHFVEDPEGDIR